ncbi:MAG: hypothetical protein K2X36_03805 [Microbacteriaceae bacterium]|nr:hypothetical protein [Microbacteriaceae bacterium]
MTNSAIATAGLSKSYGNTLALDALTLEVAAGEASCFLNDEGDRFGAAVGDAADVEVGKETSTLSRMRQSTTGFR